MQRREEEMSTPRKERCHWSCIGKPDGEHSTSCPKSFTAPTKRIHGPCTCSFAIVYAVAPGAAMTGMEHAPDCPSLYPAQQEPDALTRLVRHLRDHSEGDDEFTGIALALISEAREEQRDEQRKARNEALIQAAKVARAAAEHGCDPYAQCTCNWESKLDGVEGSILYLKDSVP